MKSTPILASALALLLLPTLPSAQEEAARPEATSVPAQEEGFLVGGGASRFGLVLPRNEELVYEASVSLGILELAAGEVEQFCRVEPYRRSVFLAAAAEGQGDEAATIQIHAEGEHSFYRLDSTISARHLPQDWPRIIYRSVSKGSSTRRRETLIGLRDGKPTVSYRKDTSKGAPKGSRIWKDPIVAEIPEDSVDMLTAVFLCRVLMRDHLDELTFPLVDKTNVWSLTLRRGQRGSVKTPAGTFDAVEVILAPEPYGEGTAEEGETFKGLFGLHGSIHLWVEAKTGIAVRIQGDLPAGPVTLNIDVRLKRSSGVPEGFRPRDAS